MVFTTLGEVRKTQAGNRFVGLKSLFRHCIVANSMPQHGVSKIAPFWGFFAGISNN